MSDALIRRVECGQCHKNFSIPRKQRGDFSLDVYKLRNGLVLPLYKTHGFCCHCDDFVWIEKLLERNEIENEIAVMSEKIKKHENRDDPIGRPTYDHLRSVVNHEAPWIEFMESRDKPLCLVCGCDDVVPVTHEQLEVIKGGITAKHPRCGGEIIGSFYKYDTPQPLINWRRFNPEAILEFNEYSSRGHKKGSFYFNVFSIMEAEVCSFNGMPSHLFHEIALANKEQEEFFNWIRAFVHSELGGKALKKTSFSIYADFPCFMEKFELSVRKELQEFDRLTKLSLSKNSIFARFLKWFFVQKT